MRLLSASTAAILLSASCALAVVVPNDRETQSGNGTFLGPTANSGRTYQLLVDDTQLAGVAGSQILGIQFRLSSGATAAFPAGDQSYTNFEVRLSGSVEPSARSFTFADNVVGTQQLVRSGPLNVLSGSYGLGGPPRPFGPIITFDSPYTYNGGNLLLELRHTGISGASASSDAMLASGGMGYGTLFSAAWTANFAGVTGAQGNAVVTNFLTIIPEPATMSLLALAAVPMMRRRRI